MNTGELLMSQLLKANEKSGELGDKHRCVTPVFPKHGDLAVCRDIVIGTIDAQARNHDPQHVPYGIRWVPKAWLATEQPTHGRKFPDDPTETKKSRQHSRAESPHDALDGRAASSTATASVSQPLSPHTPSGWWTRQAIPLAGCAPSFHSCSFRFYRCFECKYNYKKFKRADHFWCYTAYDCNTIDWVSRFILDDRC